MNHTRKYIEFATLSALVAFNVAAAADAPSPQKQSPKGISRDLEGTWTSRWLTPIERMPEQADTTHFSQHELAEQQKRSTERFWAAGHRTGDVGRDNDEYLDDSLKILPNGQTSLIVYPADGKVPIKPESLAIRDFHLKYFDSYERMSQWDRCITRQPMTMFPAAYNNGYQIVQTKDHVVILAEMVHDARVVPLGGKHIDSRIKSWSGDPRGHWEGNTLVVDSRNFNDTGWISTSGNTGNVRGMPYGAELHVVERFTRVDKNTIAYELTIEDPEHYKSPWTLSFPLTRDDGYQIFEYACHEGNTAIELILRGARMQEKAAAK